MGVNLSNNTIHTNEEDHTDYDIRQCVECLTQLKLVFGDARIPLSTT